MCLLDTNVVSELRKVRAGGADRRVAARADGVEAAFPHPSVIVVQELEIGVPLAERRDPSQGALLRAWLDGHVLPAFSGRVLAVDGAVARRCAGLRVPDPRPLRDGPIAATENLGTGVRRGVRSLLAGIGIYVLLLGEASAVWRHFGGVALSATGVDAPYGALVGQRPWSSRIGPLP